MSLIANWGQLKSPEMLNKTKGWLLMPEAYAKCDEAFCTTEAWFMYAQGEATFFSCEAHLEQRIARMA